MKLKIILTAIVFLVLMNTVSASLALVSVQGTVRDARTKALVTGKTVDVQLYKPDNTAVSEMESLQLTNGIFSYMLGTITGLNCGENYILKIFIDRTVAGTYQFLACGGDMGPTTAELIEELNPIYVLKLGDTMTGALTIGDGTNKDLLRFETKRPWVFKGSGSNDPTTTLDLKSTALDKDFRVVNANDEVVFKVRTSSALAEDFGIDVKGKTTTKTLIVTGATSLGPLTGNLQPNADSTFNLGSETKYWKDVFTNKLLIKETASGKYGEIYASETQSVIGLDITGASSTGNSPYLVRLRDNVIVAGNLDVRGLIQVNQNLDVTEKTKTKDLEVSGTAKIEGSPVCTQATGCGGCTFCLANLATPPTSCGASWPVLQGIFHSKNYEATEWIRDAGCDSALKSRGGDDHFDIALCCTQ